MPARSKRATGRRPFRESTFRATGAFMSQRVRCQTCRTAFVTDEIQAGGVVECPKCGARHRLPASTQQDVDPAVPSAPAPLEAADEVTSVFVPSNEKRARRSV